MKNNTLILLVMLLVSFKLSAADYISQKKDAHAKIEINNMSKTSASGKTTSMSVVFTATDKKGLHRNQTYIAQFFKKKGGAKDAIYDQSEEVIYISEAMQVDAMLHQITLKQISKNKFVVIEAIPTVIPAVSQQPQPTILPVLHHHFIPQVQKSPAF